MRISVVGPVYPYRGGIAHYTSALATALGKSGHNVQVISFRRQYPAILYPGRSDRDPSIPAAKVEAQYLLDPLYPWTWIATARAIAHYRPDMVIVQWWTTFWGPAYAVLAYQLRRSVLVAFLIHNVLPHETRAWDRWIARLALGQAQRFIVQAPSEKTRLLDLVPDACISYCPHPVYQRFGEQPISRDAARRHLGLPLDRLVVLFFGIVRPYKGLRYLIDALAQAGRQIHLVVAGEFWEDIASYRAQIDHLGLTRQVTILDEYIADDKAHLLFSAADALVAPYVGGTQSGAVERAVGYGLPTILTDRIASGLVGSDASRVQIVPARDSAFLAAAIARLGRLPMESVESTVAPDDWGRMVETIEEIPENTRRRPE